MDSERAWWWAVAKVLERGYGWDTRKDAASVSWRGGASVPARLK
jgi:hypothetical protein